MRQLLLAAALAAGLGTAAVADDAAAGDWDATLAAAKGQTVYFNAWGGDERINAYIAWAGEELSQRFGVTLVHVKLADTADAVARVVAEQAAGADEAGSIDLIWINGENFAAMKRAKLLHGPFLAALPSAAALDLANNPALTSDFTVPTEGYEAPWGGALFNVIYDSATVTAPPGDLDALLAWATASPGRFTYPAPPNFIGTTFLKQALYALMPAGTDLTRPPADAAAFAAATAPLWAWLDRLHPRLWRGGQVFPASGPALRQLLADGEVDFALSFNPGDADSARRQGLLPDSVRAYLLDQGGLGNTHFLAIPYNARALAGALVTINFLLTPEAQARKADAEIWGDPPVLDPAKLDQLSAWLPPPLTTLDGRIPPPLPEPHPAWTEQLEAAWLERYAR